MYLYSVRHAIGSLEYSPVVVVVSGGSAIYISIAVVAFPVQTRKCFVFYNNPSILGNCFFLVPKEYMVGGEATPPPPVNILRLSSLTGIGWKNT